MQTRFFSSSLAALAAPAAFIILALNSASATQAAALSVVAPFTGTATGSVPYGGVTRDSSGNLFGTTENGGSASDGVVWEIPAGSTTITPLASFTGANGQNPYVGVTLDSSSNLFGTTSHGGVNGDGVVWEIVHGSTTITPLASFNGANGTTPFSGVTIDSSGNLFGTTYYGGDNGVGTVWELPHGSAAISTLATFNGTNGTNPNGPLALDSSGNLFGTAVGGGANGDGAVWELPHGTATLTDIAAFNGAGNGTTPEAGLILDSSGNLFGTAYQGGSANDGTVWEIVHGSAAITPLATFTGANGSNPFGGVLLDSSGNLYGTTFYGGSANDGTLWEIPAGSATLTTLASFTGANGQNPSGILTLDSSGNILGTTQLGGSGSDGAVFKFAGHTHLLWNKTDGTAALWTVNRDTTYASIAYGPFSGWTAKATAAAPDGTNWLLWTNTNGTAALWHVTALTASGYTATQYGPYAGYTAVSLSVGSDGSPHLLWDKTDGTALLWTVNPANGSFTYTTYGPFSGWTASAVASGATVTDLLWNKTDGTASGYRIASDGSLTYHTFGPYSGYTAKSLSVGPDDGAHLLWDKTDGTALLWSVDFSSGAFTYTSYGPFPGYSARAIATGPDNITHILWNAANGTASLWNVTGSGFTYTAYGPFSGWTAVAVSAGP